MKAAVLDIGSNTSLLLIARLSRSGPKILKDEIFYTRLAEGFKFTGLEFDGLLREKSHSNSNDIPPAGPIITRRALKRQRIFFEKARALLDRHSVEKVKCVATAACRKAQNASKVLKMGEQYGFSLKIISGKEEARLSFKGALFGLSLPPARALTLDIGGASTELSLLRQGYSLPIGSVSLTQEFIHSDPPSREEISRLMKNIKKVLDKQRLFVSANSVLVATAGTPATLAVLEKGTDKMKALHGTKISRARLLYWWEYLLSLPLEKRKKLKGMPFYRADVLPAGLSLLKQSMEHFKKTECVVSTTGLRYGLLSLF